jgi:hypothetical protein
MLKKSLFLGAAVLALLVLVVLGGCSNPASETTSLGSPLAPDGLVIDAAVANEPDLAAALNDVNVRVILLDVSTPVGLAATSTLIPLEKTVYIVNSAYVENDQNTLSALTPAQDAGLNIRGTLIVGRGVVLVANPTHRISLWSSGSVQVQDNGFLATDKRIFVSNRTDQGVTNVSVLGTNVRFLAGSALAITDEPGLTPEDISDLLNILTPGTLPALMAGPTGGSTLVLSTSNLKPSQLAAVSGVSPSRSLVVTSTVNENQADFTIPAGVNITAAPGDVFTGLTNLTVNGTLNAASAQGSPDGLAFTVGSTGSLTVGTISKVKPSSVASGGFFAGRIAAFDTGAVIAAASGAIIDGYILTIASNINTPIGSGLTTVTEAKTITPENPTVIPPNSEVTFTGGVTVNSGATFTIAENANVTIPGGALSLGGTVEIPGSLTIGGGALTAPAISGKVNVQDGGSLTFASGITNGIALNGTIEIQEGGSLNDESTTAGSIWGTTVGTTASTGSFVLKTGAQAYVQGNLFVGTVADASATIQLETGALTLKKNSYDLDGNAVLKNTFGISSDMTMDIKNNSTLSITGSVPLYINGKAIISGKIEGNTSATIVVGNDPETAVTISGTGTNNFYTSGGVLISGNSIPVNHTYTWDTSLGTNSDQSGWKSN